MRRPYPRKARQSEIASGADASEASAPETELRHEARQLSLKRLSLREHSARELATYLKQRQIPVSIATEVIEQLIEEKLLDDRRYARAMTRSQAVREKGPSYILQKLRQKGVRIELDEVKDLFKDTSDRSELEMARNLVQRRYPRAASDEKELRRAYSALLRRGFSGEIARKALFGRAPAEAEGTED